MRRDGWLQKLLYLMIAVLAVYILYKGFLLISDSSSAQGVLDGGSLQRSLEDAAVRTWAPGYAAAVEEQKPPDWMAVWMEQVAPVASYLASGQTDAVQGETAGEESDTSGQADAARGETAGAEDGTSEAAETVPDDAAAEQTEPAREAVSHTVSDELLAQLEDFDFLLSNYFTVDPGTTADSGLLDIDTLLAEDLSIVQDPQSPQILIYHTHSQEAFADSREGVTADTIVGMGDVLAEELAAYGYNVIHDTGVYDLVDGELDRSAAYDYAREAVSRILEEHPTIEVVIDLHRDGVDGHKFVTEIDGRPASMIMFFNGISRNNLDEPLYWLENPYITQNLAFSMQLELKAREQYPGFTRNIYLKAERFNLHLRPRSLLIEAGTQLNTVEEEQNAMRPLADLLHQVLEGPGE